MILGVSVVRVSTVSVTSRKLREFETKQFDLVLLQKKENAFAVRRDHRGEGRH